MRERSSLSESLGCRDRLLLRLRGGTLQTGETGGEFIAIAGAAVTRAADGWQVVAKDGATTITTARLADAVDHACGRGRRVTGPLAESRVSP